MTYGAWNVTEDEYRAALADQDNADAWQVVRYVRGKPFYADDARRWLKAYRERLLSPEAEARASAAFDQLRKALD